MEGLGRYMATLFFLYAYHRSCKVFYFRIRWHFTSLPFIVNSSKQSECYIKCYCTRTNHSYSSIWLPSNQFTRFFIISLLRFAMVTELVNDILQNIWLCATDCNLVNMSKTLLL